MRSISRKIGVVMLRTSDLHIRTVIPKYKLGTLVIEQTRMLLVTKLMLTAV